MLCYDEVIKLPNGFFIGKRGLFFDLCGDGRSVIVNCNRFDYLSSKFVAMERYEKIHIFSLELVDTPFGKTMKEIASFKTYLIEPDFTLEFEDKTYIVTKNCKFKLKSKP